MIKGPIVRINPWEVHINDPAFVDTLWANSRMEKDVFFYGGFGIPQSSVATVSPESHKIRRGAMAQFFSKANVAKLEPRGHVEAKLANDSLPALSAQEVIQF